MKIKGFGELYNSKFLVVGISIEYVISLCLTLKAINGTVLQAWKDVSLKTLIDKGFQV